MEEKVINSAKKKQWIVSLRAISCLMIVFIHVLSGWMNKINVDSIEKNRYILDMHIIQLFIRSGVSLFLMISGCLLLDKKRVLKSINLKKILKKCYSL